MLSPRYLSATLLLLAAAVCAPTAVHAAESYDNCTGFITSLPTTISTQGVWCLNQNLATAITSGNAITIATNNVTIDCNDFKIGGLAAGDSSMARAIEANDRQNATVRNCSIRGFLIGINLVDGAGHLVEDNRLDNNLEIGIRVVISDNTRIRRNVVYDTGGAPNADFAYGIIGYGDIIDNTVSGVFSTGSNNPNSVGIFVGGDGNEVRGNRVRGLVDGTGIAKGIEVRTNDSGISLVDNRISAAAATAGYGIDAGDDTFCIGNTVVNFGINSLAGCDASSGNLNL